MEERLPKRSEVPEELTWRLEDIFPDTDAWEKELKEACALAEQTASFEGKLAQSAEDLLGVMKAYEACILKLERAEGYAHMRHDEDTGNAQ